MFGGPSMEDVLFQLRFSRKQLERESKKSEKEMHAQKAKVKKALQAGNAEGARIYAENAIRKKNESLNYLRFAGKIDAVTSRVQTAISVKNCTRSIATTVKALESAMNSMNLEKISAVMDKFEQQFENLDVQSSVMEGAMSSTTTLQVPEDQVSSLMKQIADESGLDLQQALPSVSQGETASSVQEDALSKRLAALRES